METGIGIIFWILVAPMGVDVEVIVGVRVTVGVAVGVLVLGRLVGLAA